MILYFDSYITDTSLTGRDRSLLPEDIRKNSQVYAMPRKIAIAKYTLASYAIYPWSHVLIRYELEDQSQSRSFDAYIKKLFPKATILHTRSDSQKDYQNSLRILGKMKDPWIFYSPNNDHPIISSDPGIASYFNKLIKKAEQWRKKYRHVSIMYSHFTEFFNIPMKRTPEHVVNGPGTRILAEDTDARVYLAPHGDFSSVQITHIDTMREWFDAADLGNKRVIRAEDTREKTTITDHIIIAPKKEIAAHFDGYEHMLGSLIEIQNDQIPPLFIPQGFFDKAIRIAYGYRDHREGWVNINPSARRYSFRDQRQGTDIKLSLEEIPLFWKPHIRTIDVNPKADLKKLRRDALRAKNIKQNPWAFRYQEWNSRTLSFWFRYEMFVIYIHLRMFLRLLGIKRFLRMVQ